MADKRISEEQVRHVARLACLALDDGEIREMSLQLGSILDFIAALDDPCVDTKNVSALPIRISIQLSSCPSCECGLMAISMHSGTGQQQKVEAVGQVEIRAHFASEICLPPRPSV